MRQCEERLDLARAGHQGPARAHYVVQLAQSVLGEAESAAPVDRRSRYEGTGTAPGVQKA